jgi:putative ABC transport system ATP-binding protein
MEKYALKLEGVKKIYNEGEDNEVQALKDIDLTVRNGEFVSIIGPSGSGKTTLLDIIGCLLHPTYGRVFLDSVETGRLGEAGLARLRREKLGFIFQQYNLIPSFTALENVAFAMRIAGSRKEESFAKARKLLETMGLGERMDHRPSQLSGGEQQRVAISRSLVNEPEIILGDEPTGNLDTKTGMRILDLLKNLNRERGYTLIVVTHDMRVTRYCDRVIHIMDGKIIKEERLKGKYIKEKNR